MDNVRFTYNGVSRSFGYDCHKRLTDAAYTNNDDSRMDFSESYSYDAMSSLTRLFRYGICDIVDGTPYYGTLDKLGFIYKGNCIDYVTVGQSSDAYGMVFDTRAGYGDGLEDSPNLYTYDANGNMTSDDSRDIKSIEYNVYNMPTYIEFYNGDSQKIEYDGAGNRLSVRYVENLPDLAVGGDANHVQVTTRRYIGDYVFEWTVDGYSDADNGVVETGSMEYVRFDGGYFDSTGMAHYLVPDFQGNTAMDIDARGVLVQETHYYPYGEPWSQPQGQPWLFGGKEREQRHHLGDSDFGARTYNAARATFAQPDPLADSYYPINPYTFCAADPINHIDPSGMKWTNVKDSLELQEKLTNSLKKCRKDLAKKEDKLNDKKSAGKDYSKIASEVEDLNARISLIEKCKSFVERLGNDNYHTYRLQGASDNEEYCVRQGENNEVFIVASNFAVQIHEIVHIAQWLDYGTLQFRNGQLANVQALNEHEPLLGTRMLNMEIEGYSFQYAIDPTSLPIVSGFHIDRMTKITIPYIVGITIRGKRLYENILNLDKKPKL